MLSSKSMSKWIIVKSLCKQIMSKRFEAQSSCMEEYWARGDHMEECQALMEEYQAQRGRVSS